MCPACGTTQTCVVAGEAAWNQRASTGSSATAPPTMISAGRGAAARMPSRMLIGRGAPLRLVNTLNEAPVPLPLASVFSGTAWAARRDRDHRPRRGNCRQRRPAATRALAQAFHRGQFQRHGIWTARICDQAQRASRGAGRQVRRHHDAQLIRQASPQQRPVKPAARRGPAGASAGRPAARLREGEGWARFSTACRTGERVSPAPAPFRQFAGRGRRPGASRVPGSRRPCFHPRRVLPPHAGLAGQDAAGHRPRVQRVPGLPGD